MENTLKVLKRVEKTHRNLGMPVVFLKIADLSNLGCFLIADRGRGKTTVLKCLEALRHRNVIKINILTWAGIASMAKLLNETETTVINYDFSSFYTDYLKDVGISLIANLITEHRVEASTARYHIKIDNCYLSFLSATQPQMIRKVNRLPAWESMYRDRFLRYFMLYHMGTPKYSESLPDIGSLTIGSAADSVDHVILPGSIREEPGYERLKAIILSQTSEGRCGMYTERMLKAHAYFNNRDTVTPTDLKFLELFAPNLILEGLLSVRERVSSPLILDDSSYLIFDYLVEHGAASRVLLRKHFSLKHAAIVRDMDLLMSIRLVRGVYGKDEFRVDPVWYAKYIMPIQEFYKEAGI